VTSASVPKKERRAVSEKEEGLVVDGDSRILSEGARLHDVPAEKEEPDISLSRKKAVEGSTGIKTPTGVICFREKGRDVTGGRAR